MSDSKLVVMTWIGRKSDVKNVKRSLKELVTATETLMPPKGIMYGCCETFDTYLKGGLYPCLHVSTDKKTIKKILDGEYVDTETLGENNVVEQAVYEEKASIDIMADGGGPPNVFAVSAFRTDEELVRDVLIKEWKTWTGARGFMLDILEAGLECRKIKFYLKRGPLDEHQTFFYVVTTEVAIREPCDEGLFVDLLQRFRVETVLGFRTIYRIYDKKN